MNLGAIESEQRQTVNPNLTFQRQSEVDFVASVAEEGQSA
jgi:hypothetical protein